MPQFIYRIQPTRNDMLVTGPNEAESAIVSQHFDYLKKLVDKGVVLMAGRTLMKDQNTFGIVIYEAASDIEAKTIMANDPAVAQGVMRAELWPFRVALWSNSVSIS